MNKTSLIAVDRYLGPVINLDNIERVGWLPAIGNPDDLHSLNGYVPESVVIRYVSRKTDIFHGHDARRIINALNARFDLEIGTV